MALFRHPSLIRGTVHTPHGAFAVVRAMVDLSDDIGQALGWEPVDGGHLTAAQGERIAPGQIRRSVVAGDQQDAH